MPALLIGDRNRYDGTSPGKLFLQADPTYYIESSFTS